MISRIYADKPPSDSISRLKQHNDEYNRNSDSTRYDFRNLDCREIIYLIRHNHFLVGESFSWNVIYYYLKVQMYL